MTQKKFHIGRSNEPAVCNASAGQCPLGGGEEVHFASKQEARQYLESARQADGKYLSGTSAKRRKKQKPQSRFGKGIRNLVVAAGIVSFTVSTAGCSTHQVQSLKNKAESVSSGIASTYSNIDPNNSTSSNSSGDNTNNGSVNVSKSYGSNNDILNSRPGVPSGDPVLGGADFDATSGNSSVPSGLHYALSKDQIQVAINDLNSLPVKNQNWKILKQESRSGDPDRYQRSYFQKGNSGWASLTGKCNTLAQIRERDLQNPETKASNSCSVYAGILADPYTGAVIHYDSMTSDGKVSEKAASAVQVDHVVALGNAWYSGMDTRSQNERIAYANDPEVLLLVDGPTNVNKSDSDFDQWKPPNQDYRDVYAFRQILIKHKYDLSVTPAEKAALMDAVQNSN